MTLLLLNIHISWQLSIHKIHYYHHYHHCIFVFAFSYFSTFKGFKRRRAVFDDRNKFLIRSLLEQNLSRGQMRVPQAMPPANTSMPNRATVNTKHGLESLMDLRSSRTFPKMNRRVGRPYYLFIHTLSVLQRDLQDRFDEEDTLISIARGRMLPLMNLLRRKKVFDTKCCPTPEEFGEKILRRR